MAIKNIWKEYNLKENDIEITLNPPSSFHALREQQIFDLKQSNYNAMATGEYVSNTFSQKKYLGWKDLEIRQNREWLRKDKELAFELAQIETLGPNWEEVAAAQAEGEAMAAIEIIDLKRKEYSCTSCSLHLPLESITTMLGNTDPVVKCVSCDRILYLEAASREAITPADD